MVVFGVSEALQRKQKAHWRAGLKPEEIRKLDAYFKRTFQNPQLQVKARPRKDDSCELYLGDEFLGIIRSEEHTSELQSRENLVCRLLLEKKKKNSDEHV